MGRQILDGIILAHELTHVIFKSKRDGMLLNLDIIKAYDRVNRNFCMLMMHKFGFQEDWLILFYECISTNTLFILINGVIDGYFLGKRGLHQGDPLSPFLFIIIIEALGRSIQVSSCVGLIEGIKLTRNISFISLLQFFGDTLIFSKSSIP